MSKNANRADETIPALWPKPRIDTVLAPEREVERATLETMRINLTDASLSLDELESRFGPLSPELAACRMFLNTSILWLKQHGHAGHWKD